VVGGVLHDLAGKVEVVEVELVLGTSVGVVGAP
jgi:hypothetical protein